MRPPQVISRSSAVLLDFDGPVCAVFGGVPDHEVAAELRALFDGALPDAVNRSRDPFDVLKYAAGADVFPVEIERRLTELEVQAVESAPATLGAAEVLEAFAQQGIPVVIVSNNSTAAVGAYLQARGLSAKVAGISARETADVEKLKPEPHLLLQAARSLGVSPTDCVMVGDSGTDIEAAQRVGALSIGYANKPGKRERLMRHKPSAIIERMVELI
ncbi:HAD family hydrolase [Saccharopolyspora sp. NPDC002376]